MKRFRDWNTCDFSQKDTLATGTWYVQEGSVAVVRARINVTGGPLIDDVIIIMHDYVARGMTSTCGRYTARICYVSCAACNSSTPANTDFMDIINLSSIVLKRERYAHSTRSIITTSISYPITDCESVCAGFYVEKTIMIKLIKCLVKKLNKISGYHNYLIFQPKILLFSSFQHSYICICLM